MGRFFSLFLQLTVLLLLCFFYSSFFCSFIFCRTLHETSEKEFWFINVTPLCAVDACVRVCVQVFLPCCVASACLSVSKNRPVLSSSSSSILLVLVVMATGRFSCRKHKCTSTPPCRRTANVLLTHGSWIIIVFLAPCDRVIDALGTNLSCTQSSVSVALLRRRCCRQRECTRTECLRVSLCSDPWCFSAV